MCVTKYINILIAKLCLRLNKNYCTPLSRYLIIRECGSTLYVGLAHAVPPTNTKFKPLLLLTQTGMPYTNTHKQRTLYFKSTLTFLGPAKYGSPFVQPYKNRKFLRCFSSSESMVVLSM